MFFFFVGGVSQKTVVLRTLAQRCINCGSQVLREERVDNVLSIFFLPVWTISKGTAFITCGTCGWTSFEDQTQLPPPPSPRLPQLPSRQSASCPGCGRHVQPDFAFCPSCGRSLVG
ncbi:hypothetical protein VOLCADRAFT_58546 [Volvox carteri f. nagariensis]|uniref:Zinc-ribbon 15 domain-containing protein n=1 Tax=Volvox carteri f. nagariensis TaxID=3068 RepID=D8TQL0_VOLCA|nr:uncharacterized protein VOLCADRAFT_58546 [Volvox carteri f. nagariensis]EFJ50170.1 hypothetical protein VOLCADRAFT_58546 [Volvox carteri f. nagariensis]|eukprot:XP_002948790.1 hypothetical protein VOLCADRAFT_58546 [Volvox carteri f. nagariensis]